MNKAEKHLFEYLKENHDITLKEREVKDFALDGSEDESDVEQWADDYAYEIAIDEIEYAATAQDRYDEEHEQEIVMSERIANYRAEI